MSNLYTKVTITSTKEDIAYCRGVDEGKRIMAKQLAEFAIGGYIFLLFALLSIYLLTTIYV